MADDFHASIIKLSTWIIHLEKPNYKAFDLTLNYIDKHVIKTLNIHRNSIFFINRKWERYEDYTFAVREHDDRGYT